MTSLLLVGAGLVAATQILPKWPREHPVVVRLDDPATVVAVELAWTSALAGDPLAGSSWRFAAGRAPRRLESTVRLPNGDYDVEIAIARTESSQTTHRSVVLHGDDEVVLPVASR